VTRQKYFVASFVFMRWNINDWLQWFSESALCIPMKCMWPLDWN